MELVATWNSLIPCVQGTGKSGHHQAFHISYRQALRGYWRSESRQVVLVLPPAVAPFKNSNEITLLNFNLMLKISPPILIKERSHAN